MRNFKLILPAVCTVLFITACTAQADLDKTLKRMNKGSVPYINAEEVHKSGGYILDSRKREEYMVSHIPEAIWVGYREFDLEEVANRLPDKSKPVIVYCSIGVRSERIGEKLKEAGYTNVSNLYGGIFEWSNKNLPLVDPNGNSTKRVHPYNSYWGRFLKDKNSVYIPD